MSRGRATATCMHVDAFDRSFDFPDFSALRLGVFDTDVLHFNVMTELVEGRLSSNW